MGDVATLLNGRAYAQDELLPNGKYKVLRVGNFFSNDKWYFSDLELDDNKYCYPGDLLYSWSASFGARIWNGDKTIFHYHIWNIKTSDKLDKKYLMYWLNATTKDIKDSGHGISMTHITKQGMEQTFIPLSSIDDQRRIVAKLEAEQEIIDANKRLIDLMQDKINQVINRIYKCDL